MKEHKTVLGDVDDEHLVRVKKLQNVFPFGRKMILCRLIEMVIMLNCYHMAAWAIVCIPLASATTSPVLWLLVGLIPILVCVALLSQSVIVSSRLLAVTELNVNVVGIIIERDRETEFLVEELRSKLDMKCSEAGSVGNKKDLLRRIFFMPDMGQNGALSHFRFRRFLLLFNLHYSNLKCNRLFNVLDKCHHGRISFQDFYSALYPELKIEEENLEAFWLSKMLTGTGEPVESAIPETCPEAKEVEAEEATCAMQGKKGKRTKIADLLEVEDCE